MSLRVKALVILVLLAALLAVGTGLPVHPKHWILFVAYVVAVLLSAGMKVSLPLGDGTMSVNFPFVFLAVAQLSPIQAMAVAAISVFAQCKFRVQRLFSLVQIAFNVANTVNATAAACFVFRLLLHIPLADGPALTAAAVVYFVVNTVPVALVLAWTRDAAVFPLWRASFLWFLPFYLVGAALSALADFLSIHHGWPTALLVVPVAYTIYRSYNAQTARTRDREQHMQETKALHLRTIEGLAMAIEAKDQETHDHLLRVRVYVTAIGKALHLSEPEMEAVKTAALLHDIGKLAVPERIINKPGKLTPEEFEKMKIHPSVGADILERVRFPYPVVPIVRSHHEWWNGMGYPDGLRGEAIPIGARILTAVDCFDALASDRPYRRAMPLAEAMEVVRKLAGTQFDPRVVEILEKNYVTLEDQARKECEKLKRLETNIAISAGVAPGAGFEQASGHTPAVSANCNASPEASEVVGEDRAAHLIAAAAEQMEAITALTRKGILLDIDDALVVLANRLSELLPFDCSVLYVKTGDELIPHPIGRQAARQFASTPVDVGSGVSGWAALHQQAIVNANPSVEPNLLRVLKEGLAASPKLRSTLSIPLRKPGKEDLLGVLSFYAEQPDAFSRNQLRAIEMVEQDISAVIYQTLNGAPCPPAVCSDVNCVPEEKQALPHLQGTAKDAPSERSPDPGPLAEEVTWERMLRPVAATESALIPSAKCMGPRAPRPRQIDPREGQATAGLLA